jgi:pimeloyl-ACP methyl ester carboxylesterase
MVARLRATAAYRYGDPRAIAQPVLVITGEDDLDRVVKPAWTREYLEAVRDARYEVLPRTGHIGMLTRPAEFADLVTRFMDQIGGDARRIPA